MWTYTHSETYESIEPEAIWSLWSDVNHWNRWDSDIEYTQLQGSFIAGSRLTLKPKGGPAVKVMLSEVNEGKSFTDYTRFPGAKMYFSHALEGLEEGVCLTNTIRVTGIFTHLWVALVAKKMAKTMPAQMDSLIKLAREQSAYAC
tara:strand:- start:83 stop:517 length:435 start_codon:yes stop_codon:yes gene_type:complete